jgi:hypothetical protein
MLPSTPDRNNLPGLSPTPTLRRLANDLYLLDSLLRHAINSFDPVAENQRDE